MIENKKKYKSIGEVAELLNLINKKSGKLSTHIKILGERI